jgi:ABC-type branched-subunit amino acid transport system substrate-binding protein
MPEKIKALVERLEPLLSQYRILLAGLTALLLLGGLLIVSGGGPPEPTEVATGEDGTDLGGDGEIEAGEGSEGSSDQPGDSQNVATGGPVPGRTINRDGISIFIPDSGGPPVANLFTPAEDRIGISKDKIVICIHAALSLASVFNVSEKSLNVYWNYVNDELGGIYGRKLEMHYTDDNYGSQPQDVIDAYEECKAQKPFLLLGGIGFDQIPVVRNLAERDRFPYIHHIARQDLSKRFAFSYLPSVETVGTRAGQWIVNQYRNRRIGVIYRDSEHWEPGHRTFKQTLKNAGITLPSEADQGAPKNQTTYTSHLIALQGAYGGQGADVVFIWENALSAIEIIQQAADQQYFPKWVVFPFNLMTETLADNPQRSNIKMDGISAWAPYVPGAGTGQTGYQPGRVDGSFAQYAQLIREFERQHNKYAPGENRDDIVFMTWGGWAQIHQLLLECGKDCTRNKVVGLLQSGVHQVKAPGCPIDFTRNGHVGGFSVNIFKDFMDPVRDGWREVAHCKTGF